MGAGAMIAVRSFLAVVSLLGLSGCPKPEGEPPPEPLRVAAAADLEPAFREIGRRFEAEHPGGPLVFSFGSSGLLARQIEEGAPFSLFAAANREFVDRTVRAGRCRADTVARYAEGRLVVWWRTDAKLAPPSALAELADPRFAKIAIANPEHAP
jgi:molybdate transport system substrate-binding protein